MRIVRRAATKYQKAVMTQPWYMRYEARYDDIGKYEDRTFFPVYLGDKLDDGRYVIWDKLGSGSKSHVWLAKDQHSGCFVAVKLLPRATANLESNIEMSILQHVQRRASKSPSGSEYIRKYLRNFTEHRGVEEYSAIVLEATGQSVQSKLSCDSISFAKAKHVIRDTIRGLRYLHEECKVAHGDLYFGNINFAAPDLIGMNDDQVLECIGPIKQEPVISLCGGLSDSSIPKYTVGDACFDADGPVKLTDFGGAWRFGERPAHVDIYPIYRPPELIGESGRLTNDTGVDLWMLGCTIFRIFAGGSLFDEWRDDHLRAQINAVINNGQTKPGEVLYQRISENAPEIAEDDRRQLVRILGALIIEDPEQRLSASKLEQDPWLQK